MELRYHNSDIMMPRLSVKLSVGLLINSSGRYPLQRYRCLGPCQLLQDGFTGVLLVEQDGLKQAVQEHLYRLK